MSNLPKINEATTDAAPAVVASTPQDLLQLAVSQGADIDKLEKLMDLQDRWENKEAEKSFRDAICSFQSKAPVIKKLSNGHGYKFAPLGDIVEQIRPALSESRLSYRWEFSSAGENIVATCIVSHSSGHSEKTAMQAQPDNSGKKNGIQAIGSTHTYLQRYTLIGALGIATADEDIDARMDTILPDFISDAQISEIEGLIGTSGANREKFLRWIRVTEVKDIPARSFAKVVSSLKQRASK